jgi:hypothetical protein
MTFKPKKQQIHVPGKGIVQKEDFSQEHFDILIKRAGGSKEKRDAFINQHFVVASYGDQPLFVEEPKSEESEAPENALPKEEKKNRKGKKSEESEA